MDMSTSNDKHHENSNLIIDAIFEMRFSAKSNLSPHEVASKIMTEMLTSHIGKTTSQNVLPLVRPTSIGQMPGEIRLNDENLRYMPTYILENVVGYRVGFSEHMLAVICTMPYRRWTVFKAYIKRVVSMLGDINFDGDIVISRYSLKYADFIEESNIEEYLDIQLKLGEENNIIDNSLSLKIEQQKKNCTVIREVITKAKVPNIESRGVVIVTDVITDTASEVKYLLKEFIINLDEKLDKIHLVGKQNFFSLLTEKAQKMLSESGE